MSLEVLGRVLLPICTAGLSTWWERRKAKKEKEQKAKAPRLLLLVEDDASDVELMAYFLKHAKNANPDKYSIEIEVAFNTEDAWTLFLQRHHDIVLVDMRFPHGEQGWVLAEKMRRHDVMTQIVIVYTMVEDLIKLPSGQIFSFMRKPPTYEGILQLLAKLK